MNDPPPGIAGVDPSLWKQCDSVQYRQLWKIQHIGQHYYSIRSLYRPNLVLHANDNGTIASAMTSKKHFRKPLLTISGHKK